MANTPKARIMVIDDEESIRQYLEHLLGNAGYEVVLCRSGADVGEALSLFSKPDLVITDIVMPGQDGIEVLIALKEEHPKLKVIVISGAHNKDVLLRLAEVFSADGVMDKPFEPAQLLALVRDVLQGCGTEKEHA